MAEKTFLARNLSMDRRNLNQEWRVKSEQHKLPLTVTLFDGIHLAQVTVLQQIKKICVTELFFFLYLRAIPRQGLIFRGEIWWRKKKMWKWINQHVMNVGLTIWTYDLPKTGQALYPLEIQRTHGERGHILGSYLTRFLHNARICNVNFVLWGDWMKDGKF